MDAGLVADRSLRTFAPASSWGSGGPSARTIVEAADIARTKGPKRVGPFAVPKAMSSTASATLATWFKIKGVNYSISSACATSNHCIGNAYETIQIGKQDIIFAGGCEELDWSLVGAVRRDGRDVLEVQRHALDRLASLRRQPRRLRDRGRCRRGGARRARTCQSARREDLRRSGRLRRDLGRLRYGRAVGRRRRALHAHGDGDREDADRLHQPARHFDARPAIRRKSRRSARYSAPATSARRSRRPRR